MPSGGAQYSLADRCFVPHPREDVYDVIGSSSSIRTVLDWRPAVNKPIVKYLTPVLRPLFAWNHTWTMRSGQEHILDRMRGRGSGQAREAGP